MKIVKLSTSFGHQFLPGQIGGEVSLQYKFEIDNDCKKCDYWIVWGDLPIDVQRMKISCPKGNLIYMTDEAFAEKKFNQAFLNQFDIVLSCRTDIAHKNLIRTHEINTWHIKKQFSELDNNDHIEKKKKISVVSSDLTFLPGHKKRFAFVNKMIGHFKDRIDVFGKGTNPIADKWDGLANYKYSIAIENSALPGYFTEKITECYLAHTFPIYYGAPDIADYFDPSSFLIIDIDDYKTSIQAIEKLLEEDPWEKREQLLMEQKHLYLSNYHLFSAIGLILSNLPVANFEKKSGRSIKAHRTYDNLYIIKKLAKKAQKILGHEK